VADKVFKTYDEQIEILRLRGLTVNDDAKDILKKENYYNVINGYKDLFLDNQEMDEKYKSGTNFMEIYALYEFDRELRFIFLRKLLKVENYLKSIIAYRFSEKYGHDNYLKIENFEPHNKNVKKSQNVMQVISTLQKSISDQIGKHNAVTHYITEYGYVPLWVLVNVLTFGNISKFYGVLKLQDRHAIAKVFTVQENILKSYLKLMSVFRNICAHDERLYNAKLNGLDIVAGNIHNQLGIKKDKNGKYIHGINDVFALLICLKELLREDDITDIILQINERIAKLEQKIYTVEITEILSLMGLPENWKKV